MYTLYTCIYTIYTPSLPLNTPYTPHIHPKYTLSTWGRYTINEDAQGNVYVKGLSIIPVSTPEEVVTIIQMGLRLRATHEVRGEGRRSREERRRAEE